MSEEKKEEYLEENAESHDNTEELIAEENVPDNEKTDEKEKTAEDADLSEAEAPKEKEETKEREQPQKKSLGKRVLSGGLELLLYVMIAVICVFVVPRYVVQRTQVSGPSMEATLHNKDNILVEKLSYRFGDPKRFDIIVFYHFEDADIRDKDNEDCYDFYVKRIIGLPGEKVQIIQSEESDDYTIYINDEPLEETYGKDPITDPGIASEPIVLDEGEYFVLGDNREVSQDSRYEVVGNIKREDIVGKAWLRIYPFSKFGFLND